MILFGVMGRRGAMCVCSQFMQFGRSLVGIVWHSSLILPFTPPSDPVARSRAGDLREGTTWRSLGRHHTSTSATRFVAAGRHSETAVGVKSTIRSERKVASKLQWDRVMDPQNGAETWQTPKTTDQELVEQSKRGDEAAMAKLIGRHYGTSLRIARSIL